ncbi:hypothetical protein HHK36_019057 [Tetracentron sinense]|uniref:Dol-P-Glc:Glc(2)Man(9)GlcNAc(2)-PP-Dol alpha-1,2-glucosyltransferase n=1 Tax=Tetracentron sinense TaxID=13715 RepID=A0A835D9N8_TETSI|nr:hypothetical protein HHK36_019057 [Tetracentron sinense]
MGRIAIAVTVSLWVIPISIMVDLIVPEPYMATSSFSDLCSTSILRSINGGLAIICSILVYEIIIQLRPALDERKATLYAVVLALYPLHWFFSFLYYTDVASLTVVLAMYLACLKKHYQFSALLGTLAVLIRQTNVIWMLFVACIGVINFAVASNHKDNVQLDNTDVSIRKIDQLTDNKSVPLGSHLRKRKTGNAVNTVNLSISGTRACSLTHATGLLDEFQAIILRLWHLKWEVLVSFSPFLLVLGAFVAFVLWNGSVVLGAKEAHAVSPHFAQIMYFGLLSALAMAPLHFTLDQTATLRQLFLKNKPLCFFQGLIVLTTGFLSVHFFSIAHPYLLADNRHYPFYLWRKVIKAHWLMKYLLVPLYGRFNIRSGCYYSSWLLLQFLSLLH